jgi:hypothetical protein
MEHPRKDIAPASPRSGYGNSDLASATRYLQAYRAADLDAMASMSSDRSEALAAGLSEFAASVVPIVREVVGDDVYVRVMDGLAAAGAATERGPAIAVELINSRGGVDGRTWAARGGDVTARTSTDTTFRMAATLSFLMGLTAAFTHRDADETFLHFADLVHHR